VAEREVRAVGQQQPAAQASLQVVELRCQQFVDQPAFDMSRHHRGELQDVLCRRRQARGARQHHVLHGGGHGAAGTTQHFGHEERIAARDRVHAGGRSRGPPRQRFDGLRREPRQVDARALRRGQLSQHAAQRMRARHFVVAEAHGQQRVRALDAATQELQQVQRRVVGPVRVLDDHQHRRSG